MDPRKLSSSPFFQQNHACVKYSMTEFSFYYTIYWHTLKPGLPLFTYQKASRWIGICYAWFIDDSKNKKLSTDCIGISDFEMLQYAGAAYNFPLPPQTIPLDWHNTTNIWSEFLSDQVQVELNQIALELIAPCFKIFLWLSLICKQRTWSMLFFLPYLNIFIWSEQLSTG